MANLQSRASLEHNPQRWTPARRERARQDKSLELCPIAPRSGTALVRAMARRQYRSTRACTRSEYKSSPPSGVRRWAALKRGAQWSKDAIDFVELVCLRGEGLRFGTVLADAIYGDGAAFQQIIDARSLRLAVGIACDL